MLPTDTVEAGDPDRIRAVDAVDVERDCDAGCGRAKQMERGEGKVCDVRDDMADRER